ncbi:MAG: SpoIID/LytB domain-containing protein [Actinobacteria bacterium]|nr:SpoIID/LytB domain-containing protein [Thermoleophilia bacterium]MCB9012282.1 SpoIID/LytB domain-containing protein [Actinomycetota bacterium]
MISHRWTLGARSAGIAALVGGCLIATAATASAEVSFTFEGRGFGHGVGMSQYGARGAARQGWSTDRILTWYYRGATIETRTSPRVRIMVAAARTTVTVGVTGGDGTLVDARDGERIPLAAGVRYTARIGPAGLTLTAPSGDEVDVAVTTLRIVPKSGALVQVEGSRFRGVLDLNASGGTVDVINNVDMDAYLRGVVPREMPASWGDTPAALEAQAIAARSYATTSLRPTASFDLYSDVRSQVYGGVANEDPRSDAAVAATTRRVLVYDGAVIRAYYSSTSGGHTENVEYSLGGSPLPYLVGVPDPFDDVSPLHRWPSPPTFTATALGQKLRVGGPVATFEVLNRGVSPRVRDVRVTTTSGVATVITGQSVKARLGLLDTWFWVRRSDRPAPAEPAYKTANPVDPAPVTPPSTPGRRWRVGDYLVVVTRQPRRIDGAMALRQVRLVRPKARLVVRGSGASARYLVVAGRTRSRSLALRERNDLRRLGFAPILMRARAEDPGVVMVSAAQRAEVAGVALRRYRVIALAAARPAQARRASVDLGATGRRTTVVPTRVAGQMRYFVVTRRKLTLARSLAEVRALARVGYRAIIGLDVTR